MGAMYYNTGQPTPIANRCRLTTYSYCTISTTAAALSSEVGAVVLPTWTPRSLVRLMVHNLTISNGGLSHSMSRRSSRGSSVSPSLR